ncbi:hypothetical protein ZHAS_00020337 [Anopheles sinensis]|uniref:Uncharacterized protein n=1 Tax=Anopheles sinensis TaxID=74873 RepID=A0A084WPT1_ANOSI|nr:hypothetical protein ZHAS_00020337 [Anopheles sinensis]
MALLFRGAAEISGIKRPMLQRLLNTRRLQDLLASGASNVWKCFPTHNIHSTRLVKPNSAHHQPTERVATGRRRRRRHRSVHRSIPAVRDWLCFSCAADLRKLLMTHREQFRRGRKIRSIRQESNRNIQNRSEL